MKKQKIIELYQALNSLGNLSGVKFSYAVVRNINILKPEIEALQEVIKPSEEFTKYEQERIELAKEHSKKDDKGEPMSENNKFILEDEKKFEKEFEKLKEKNKKVFDDRQKQIDEYITLLETESSMELFKIDISDVPEGITTQQMNSIYELIEEQK